MPKSFPVCTIRSTPSQPIHCIVWAKSYLFTEIFGTSEDEIPEFDHSEDNENAKEIENLKQESQALNSIRQSMDSDDFARKVFDKVFKDDINRLRSMEDMWKTRKQPNALDFDDLSKGASGTKPSVAQQDQKVWSIAENFTVFCDRYVLVSPSAHQVANVISLRRLSTRLQTSQTQPGVAAAAPVLVFDKDDEDTLDFVAASANLRSIIFGIESKSKFDIKQMAGNIIPAIATTNAMTASLCVMQAFKVMRGDIAKAKMVFLERSAARVINSDTLKRPNPNCNVCGVMSSTLIVDPDRATLNDLVEDVLKLQLGYGDEFSINNEVGTLYDPDLDDNLPKKFSDLGVKADSFLTVIDDDDENPRVNLSLAILEKTLPEDTKAIQLPKKLDIARKPKDAPASITNGHVTVSPVGTKRKRSLEDPENGLQQDNKRGKIQMPSKAIGFQDDDLIIADDSNDGAIIIDD